MLPRPGRWYLLTGGLLSVLLVLASFVVWGVQSSESAGNELRRAIGLRSSFEQVTLALSQMQSAERGYVLEPGPQLLADYRQAFEQANAALAAGANDGGEPAQHLRMQADLRALDGAMRGMFAARDTGDVAAAHRLDLQEDALYDELTALVRAEVADHRLQATAALDRLGTVQEELTVRTPLIFVAGLLLTVGLLLMLRGLQRDLHRRALTDELTGLPNRVAFQEALHRRLGLGGPERVAVLLVDLDHFKDVNDTLGHHVGDELLLQVGVRLRTAVRRDDLVARMGGDEFAVLLGPGFQPGDAEEVAGRLRVALEEPLRLDELELQVSGSIGLACYPDDAQDAAELMQRADVAMYAAKRSGAGQVTYSGELESSTPRQLMLLAQLAGAVEREELVLHYQPIVEVATGRVVGAEALIRWEHPVFGLLPPLEFIPAAESSGALRHVTEYVLVAATQEAAGWAAAGVPLTVSVNVSARCLVGVDLPGTVAGVLAASGLPARLLKLEITESAIMEDPDRARLVLQALADLGVTLSVDDFGTGYTSLAYLADLPVGELKIDRSFVARLTTDAKAATIVQTSLDLAGRLGLSVVAEGVEDAATLASLQRLGCPHAQGYLFDRPLPAAAFAAVHAGRLPAPRESRDDGSRLPV